MKPSMPILVPHSSAYLVNSSSEPKGGQHDSKTYFGKDYFK